MYPYLSRNILKAGDFGELPISEAVKEDPWVVILFMTFGIGILFILLEMTGV